ANAVCTHALVGMQPMRRHVPPRLWLALDVCHAYTELCRTDRSGIAPRAAPENGNVDFHHTPPVGSQLLVGEELADGCGDLIYVRLEREVTRVQQLDIRCGDVALKGFGSCGQKERVVAAPDGQQRWLVSAEVVLEPRVEVDIARVVENE